MKNYTQYPTHIITDLIPKELLISNTIKSIMNSPSTANIVTVRLQPSNNNKVSIIHTIPISKIKEQLYLAQ